MNEGMKRAATFVLLSSGNKWLMLKRNKEPNVGMYVPVGGKIDPYEEPLQAARREVKEEVGIDVVDLIYCGTLVETSPTKYNWISFIYTCEIEEIALPDCDEGELHWVMNEDMVRIHIPPTDPAIFKFVKEARKFALNAMYDAELNLIWMKEEISGEKMK
jgi:8-oxo-dGTP diphosphatase